MFRNALVALVSCLLLGLVLAQPLAASPLRSVTFSFASDDHADGPTFTGFATNFGSSIPVDLMVDINDHSGGGVVIFPSDFISGVWWKEGDYQVVAVGSNFLHVWRVSGRLDFFHRDALAFTPLLTVGWVEGVLTSLSPFSDRVGQAATLHTTEGTDSFTALYSQNLLLGIGVTPADIEFNENVAFTLTNIRVVDQTTYGTPYPRVDKDGVILDEWTSEGSFSAGGSGPED